MTCIIQPAPIARELSLVTMDGKTYATFNSQSEYTTEPRRVRRLLTPKEAECARMLIDQGNEADINQFCYSIV